MELSIIKKIIAILEESNLKKIHLREGDFEISLEKESDHPIKPPPMHHHHHKEEKPHPKEKLPLEEKKIDEKDFVLSPMVGTFYSATSPDQPAFVKIGDKVNEDTVICIIEAMKVMNEIKAETNGTIADVLVTDGQAVEYGQVLFKVKPD